MWRTTFDKQGANELHKISIHVLHVEDDFRAWTWTRPSASFQSTSSMWRTTSTPYFSGSDRIFQSTSSMWRTTGALGYTKDGLQISIHVLHVEDDESQLKSLESQMRFQSTSSMWRTTWPLAAVKPAAIFQSTSSMWRTTSVTKATCSSASFQSTSSMWRTTTGKF